MVDALRRAWSSGRAKASSLPWRRETPLLKAMHFAGQVFPAAATARPRLRRSLRRRWRGRPSGRASPAGTCRRKRASPSGFYISQAMRLWRRRCVVACRPPFTLEMLPFADAASAKDLPLGRLLRLSLFQVSVGMATVMLLGTLNRVMIVELSVPAMLVAAMIALPVLIAPFRALLGLPVGHAPVGHRVEAGAVYLVRLALAVRRAGHHAVCADRAVGGPDVGPRLGGRGAGGGGIPDDGAGSAHDPDRGAGAGEQTWRPRRRGRGSWRLLYVMFLLGMAASAVILGGASGGFLEDPADPGRAGRGRGDAGPEPDRALETGGDGADDAGRAGRAPSPVPGGLGRLHGLAAQAGRLLAVVALGTCAVSMQDVSAGALSAARSWACPWRRRPC